MDNYSVNYINKADDEHLNAALSIIYKITSNWSGGRYLGLTLKWEYEALIYDMSMPIYIETILQKLKYATATQSQHSTHLWTLPNYGQPTHLATDPDQSAPLPADTITHL